MVYTCMSVWVYGCMSVWVYECMSVWVYECMSVRVYECMSVWVYECMSVWVYECMSVWVYECMSVWVYECMSVCVCVSVWVCECVSVWACEGMSVCVYESMSVRVEECRRTWSVWWRRVGCKWSENGVWVCEWVYGMCECGCLCWCVLFFWWVCFIVCVLVVQGWYPPRFKIPPTQRTHLSRDIFKLQYKYQHISKSIRDQITNTLWNNDEARRCQNAIIQTVCTKSNIIHPKSDVKWEKGGGPGPWAAPLPPFCQLYVGF